MCTLIHNLEIWESKKKHLRYDWFEKPQELALCKNTQVAQQVIARRIVFATVASRLYTPKL